MVIHQSLFKKYGGFNESLPRFEDSELSLRLHGNQDIPYVADVLVHHPVPKSRICKKYFKEWFYDMGRIIDSKIFKDDLHQILGIPRWVYKEILIHWKVKNNPAYPSNDRFFHELQLERFAGLIKNNWSLIKLK